MMRRMSVFMLQAGEGLQARKKPHENTLARGKS